MAETTRPGPDGRWQLEWIDRDADEGPVFRIGADVYSRTHRGQRVLELAAVLAPGTNYEDAAVEGFRELARAWGAPIVFVINPQVRRPPAARFLYRWSQAAYHNGSVERTLMLTTNLFTQQLGRFIIGAFTADMPAEAQQGRENLEIRLAELDLSCHKRGFKLNEGSGTDLTANVERPQGMFGQLLGRIRRAFGGAAPR